MVSCKVCSKSVYPNDPQLNVDGVIFHKTCAKCADCECQITLSNFASIKDSDSYLLVCKTHYSKRFKESGGSYPGGDKYQVKSVRDVRAASVSGVAKDPLRSGKAEESSEVKKEE